ncbi:MAG: phosphosulfolactate synthase [Candidatus Binatia bacterium]
MRGVIPLIVSGAHRNGSHPLYELFSDPERTQRPREKGITHVLDKGMSVADIASLLEVAAAWVDIIKFGWGTSVVVENLEAKIDACLERGVDIYCGGSLFELALQRGKLDDYVAYLKDRGIRLIEISDGVIALPAEEKRRHIERLARDFKVLSEVGSKDSEVVVAPSRWVKQIREELDAGAWKVITEGRESGTVGLYRGSGEIRTGLIDEIESQIDTSRLMFEAPQKAQQVWLIKHFGPNVNLGNIPPTEVIALETMRQGLRADTMLHQRGERRREGEETSR